MVIIVTTLSSIRRVAVDVTALLASVLKVKYMAGGSNFNYHAWYWTVLFERMLVTVDGDVEAATQLVKKRKSEDSRKGGLIGAVPLLYRAGTHPVNFRGSAD
eukprot:1478-Heterococcus_DN1.PRE.1